jgi:hypothetical protein
MPYLGLRAERGNAIRFMPDAGETESVESAPCKPELKDLISW